MSYEKYDVVIIGAGPVGLTCALELNRQGIKNIVVIEKEKHISPQAKASIIHCGTMDLLRNYPDLIERITPELNLLRNIHYENLKGHKLKLINNISVEDKTDNRVSSLGVQMHGQFKTQTALLDVLRKRGVKVKWGLNVTNFIQDEDGVEIQGDKWAFKSKQLVGADGAHSFVRKKLNVQHSGESLDDLRVILCHLEVEKNDSIEQDSAYLLSVHKPVDMFICPLVNNELQIMLPQTPEESKVFETRLDRNGRMKVREPTVEEIMERIKNLLQLKDFKVKEVKWKTTQRLSTQVAEQQVVGRVALVGDACHSHSPIGAYGMNTGIQDAINLGWKLAMQLKRYTGMKKNKLLDSYHQERFPIGKLLCESTHQRTKNFGQMEYYTGFMRKVISKMTSLFPSQLVENADFSKTFMFDNLQRNSHLSENHGTYGQKSILAGDRITLGISKLSQLCIDTQGFKIILMLNKYPEFRDEIQYLQEIYTLSKQQLTDLLVQTASDKHYWRLDGQFNLKPDGKESVDLLQVQGARNSLVLIIRPDNFIAFRSEPADLNMLNQQMNTNQRKNK